MNIQIFGTKKSADTRKAQRWFQERRIKFQFVDLSQKGMSKGEFESVARVVGGQDAMIDQNCKDQKTLTLIKYLVPDQQLEKILENQQVLKQPIVRNGKQATLGYQPDVWQTWDCPWWLDNPGANRINCRTRAVLISPCAEALLFLCPATPNLSS